MGFQNILFPTDISYRSSGGPAWKTHILENDDGTEVAISKWSTPRGIYNAVKAVQTQEQLTDLLAFVRIMEGAASSFRYKDWSDYASTADGLVPVSANPPGDLDGRTTQISLNIDQQIGVGDGVETIFQLIKRYQYTSGAVTLEKIRPISKPVVGSVKIAVDGTGFTETTHYTLDYSTGLVTFTTAPPVDELVTAGFEFDVPCRFGEEFDSNGVPAQITAFNQMDISSIPIIEKRDTLPTDEQRFAGGADTVAFSGGDTAYQIGVNTAKVLTFTGPPSGMKVYMPDIGGLPKGGELFVIRNDVGSSNAIEIWPVGGSGSKLFDLAIGDAKRVFHGLDESTVSEWIFV